MEHKIAAFLQKNNIQAQDIKYILREDGRTNLYLLNGQVVSTYHPIKDFREYLPVEHFLCPNKGILLADTQVTGIQDGCYLTADGRSFKYRVHNSRMHDTRLLTLARSHERTAMPEANPYACVDKMPLAVMVVEYVPKDNNQGADFTVRYCNEFLCKFENRTPESMLGRSVTELFPQMNFKWQVVYADVALNGTSRTIEEFDPGRGVWVHAYFHQCAPGFCMTALLTHSGEIHMNAADGETKVGIV